MTFWLLGLSVVVLGLAVRYYAVECNRVMPPRERVVGLRRPMPEDRQELLHQMVEERAAIRARGQVNNARGRSLAKRIERMEIHG